MRWPRCFSVAAASARRPTSVVPPAANGTIIVTGRLGKSCACAAPVEMRHATATTMARAICSAIRHLCAFISALLAHATLHDLHDSPGQSRQLLRSDREGRRQVNDTAE